MLNRQGNSSPILLGALVLTVVLGVALSYALRPASKTLPAGQTQSPIQPQTQSPTSPPTPTPKLTFSSGIYYRLPNLLNPSAILQKIGGGLPLNLQMSPVDFSIRPDRVVYATANQLHLVAPDGTEQVVTVSGLYQMARPNFSPDGSLVAVQATDQFHPQGETASPNELGIYVINLSSGEAKLVSPQKGLVPAESPVWFHQSSKLAYSSFSPRVGIDIHIYDFNLGREVELLPGVGSLHLAISKDDRQVVDLKTLRIFDLASKQLVADLRLAALSGLTQAGYALETEFTGDAGSSFPLDGDFSPDGQTLVFDGAVRKDGQRGAIIAEINRDGSHFSVLTDVLPQNPQFSNRDNFSQVNPTWL